MKTKKELLADLEKLCGEIKELLGSEEETPVVDKRSDVEHQIWRSDTAKRLYFDDSADAKELEKELDKDLSLFKNKDIQSILDGFDWDECVDAAQKLGYKYGIDENTITKERLVEDALEMFRKLESSDTKCGRLQTGRLIVNKFYDFEENTPWYTMNFFIENNEAY